jgi:hypothetical protein
MDPDPDPALLPWARRGGQRAPLGRLDRVLMGNPRQPIATSPGCTSGQGFLTS